jgi:hypothetical protein
VDASNRTRYVVLRGGLALPLEPILLALELEERGFGLTRDGDVLSVQPYERLTRDDCQRIRRWKLHLLALIDYVPESVQ